MTSQSVQGTSGPVGVLVAGDWLVDEHWVVGRHRSSTSNRTGRDHSRALHTDRCSVRSLCGAGQVATILYQTEYRHDRHHHDRPFSLTGLGLWHPEDTPSLSAMLDPSFNFGRTPHRLTDIPAPLSDAARAAMHNLAPAGVRVGTTRIIRIYENTPHGPDLRRRLDWELSLAEDDTANIRKTAFDTVSSLSRDISHIVVKDLRKGVITWDLVAALRNKFPSAFWYLSSKEWDPEWLKALEPDRLRLIFIPRIAAQRAVTQRVVSSTWLTYGSASREALVAIRALAERFPNANIVVMPDDQRILAYEAHQTKPNDGRGFALPSTSPKQPFFPYLPMASVFFPALMAQMATIEARAKTPLAREPRQQSDFLPMLQDALAFTERWQAHELGRLTNPASWKPAPQQAFILHDHPQRTERAGRWHPFQWKEAKGDWDMALEDLGVITIDPRGAHPRKEFQLWRGMTEIRGYIACDPQKRLALSHLVREGMKLRDALPDERRHRSFLLIDVPGSGKSYMVDRLRNELGLESKHFNVTRLSKKNEIFDWFQEIAAAQSHSNRPLLVFVDEINAPVDQSHIYDAFLEPLEDGKYVRGGSVWRLAPCFWIFAGTKEPKKSVGSVKGEDFESRLSHPTFHIKQGGKERDIAKVERVYVGVSCLLQRFPEVTRISPRVLRAFYLLSKAVPREVRRFVWDFEEVQYGRAIARNLPKEWKARFGANAAMLYDPHEDAERELVDIRVSPSH